MAKKTGTKAPARKFRGFANLVKDVDVEALRAKMAEGRRLFFESLKQEDAPVETKEEPDA